MVLFLKKEKPMRNSGNLFCIATGYNKPFRSDGDEFTQEMCHFMDAHYRETDLRWGFRLKKPGADKKLGKTIPSLRQQFSLFIDECYSETFNTFAFFVHGTWRSILGLNHNIWSVHMLAYDICQIADLTNPINIILYGCSMGTGAKNYKDIHEFDYSNTQMDMNGYYGVAMRLAFALTKVGVHNYRIYAHLGRGHTTRYPHCVWIEDHQEEKKIVRTRIVPYVGPLSSNKDGRKKWLSWEAYLKKTYSGRFIAPFLDDIDLEKILRGEY
jgi:hypothetical protein